MNIVFSIIFVLGISVIFAKADINIISTIVEYLMHADFDAKKMLFELFLMMISSTIAFTALTSTIFIGIKSFFPNGQGLKIISYISSVFLLQTITQNITNVASYDNGLVLLYSGVMVLLSVICYFGSVWFIQNKLEVYN